MNKAASIHRVVQCAKCHRDYPHVQFTNQQIGGFVCECGNIFAPYTASVIYINENHERVVKLKDGDWVLYTAALGKVLDAKFL